VALCPFYRISDVFIRFLKALYFRKEVADMAITKKEAYYNSSTGVNKIRALIWQDESVEPIGIFQIAHGVSEHIDRYDHFAKFLAERGYIVCGNDHLGHGKSVSSEEDLGFTAEEEGFRRFVVEILVNS
jgi:alpha-beta hydrolase superfamily lysophospholipase